MKRPIIILSAVFIAFSLTAYGYIKINNSQSVLQNNTEFVYSIDSRFKSTITKNKIDKANTILDIINRDDIASIDSFYNIKLSSFKDLRTEEVLEVSKDEVLTKSQKSLLKSMGYGSSFYIVGNIRKVDESSGEIVVDTLINYMTVLPSNPAIYKEGKDALVSYLKEGSKEVISIAYNTWISPGKISFTVTKEGTIDHVKLGYTCSYDVIDNRMIELLKNIPGSWDVATNVEGVKVDQEITFFYGIIGC